MSRLSILSLLLLPLLVASAHNSNQGVRVRALKGKAGKSCKKSPKSPKSKPSCPWSSLTKKWCFTTKKHKSQFAGKKAARKPWILSPTSGKALKPPRAYRSIICGLLSNFCDVYRRVDEYIQGWKHCENKEGEGFRSQIRRNDVDQVLIYSVSENEVLLQ